MADKRAKHEHPVWLITGAAGFIGANLVRLLLERDIAHVVALDNMAYPAVPENVRALRGHPGFTLVEGDLRCSETLYSLFRSARPDAVINLAAQSHVDRSIEAADGFVETNVLGTQRLLDASRRELEQHSADRRHRFRFLQVSTDEVFGSLDDGEPPFTVGSPYRPNSPYAASKAGADHLVYAARHTHGLATLICHCTNNYGPRQHPEKLIPLAICNALAGRPIPLYGDGRQRRDWLAVEDHCEGLVAALERGVPDGASGGRYVFGSGRDRSNLEVLELLCTLLDTRRPEGAPHARLITPVSDRPGHDRRYAVDPTATSHELEWRPTTVFSEGLARTVDWYLDNPGWIEAALDGERSNWISRHYAEFDMAGRERVKS